MIKSKGGKKMAKPDLSQLAKSWPSPIVARSSIRDFSGGLILPGTLANLDSLGKGPAGKFRVGQKVAYPVDEVIRWLESRLI